MNLETRAHKYDNPKLRLKEFLLAVMRDPTVPLGLRIEAAAKAMLLQDAGDRPDLREAAITYHFPVLQ
jgi:hypothetical protein